MTTPGGLAEVDRRVAVHDAARVPRVRERDLDARFLDRAALVPPFRVVLGKALTREPVADLDQRDHGTAEALRELHRLAEMVAVAVGEHDQVDPLGLALVLGHLGFWSQGST